MLPFCLICCEHIQDFLKDRMRICMVCRQSFSPAVGNKGVISVFAYEGTLRSLILRAKVDGDPLATDALLRLFTSAEKVSSAVSRSTHIVAAPSSLWGRCRGKTDLAALLAMNLAKISGRPLVKVSSRLFWSWKKQAQRKDRRHEGQLKSRWGGALVVDDIITTGYTLRRVGSTLQDSKVGFLTLAQAR